jgi:tetratricopeptide (TPR) repeat protein
MSLGNYGNAIKCYEGMLRRAKELKDPLTEAQAFGNLGIARMNLGSYEEATSFLQQQISVLERMGHSPVVVVERGRALGNLGDCLSYLGDYEEALQSFEKSLQVSVKVGNASDQERTYRCIGLAFRALGEPERAIGAFEKRLHLSLRLGAGSESEAYGDLGLEHLEMRNFEQALDSLQNSFRAAKESGDKVLEGIAVASLGNCFQAMGKFGEALEFHEMDLRLAEETGSLEDRMRALGNIGLAHESLFDFEQALSTQEQYLSLATQAQDGMGKMLAYSSIGEYTTGNHCCICYSLLVCAARIDAHWFVCVYISLKSRNHIQIQYRCKILLLFLHQNFTLFRMVSLDSL